MSAERLVARFRQFLLWLAIALCVGIVVELFLIFHHRTNSANPAMPVLP